MNRELEALVLAYERVSSLRDSAADQAMQEFDAMIETLMEARPGLSRDVLRKSIIRAHARWARKQASQPPSMPRKA